MPGANGPEGGGAEGSVGKWTQNRLQPDPFWVRQYVCPGESGYARRISSRSLCNKRDLMFPHKLETWCRRGVIISGYMGDK